MDRSLIIWKSDINNLSFMFYSLKLNFGGRGTRKGQYSKYISSNNAQSPDTFELKETTYVLVGNVNHRN